MKKSKYIIEMFVLIFLFSIVMNGCAMFTINQYYPDPAAAENPPGLAIDTENFAYLGGPIRAIGSYDFNPGKGAILDYSGRTVRVPAGEEMTVLVHYSYTTSNSTTRTLYYGFKPVSVPPLKNGNTYVLFIDNPKAHDKWENKNIKLLSIDPVSWRINNIPGAKFVNQSILIPGLYPLF